MSKYAWIIDIDHKPDESAVAPSNLNAKGMLGPRNATDEQELELNSGAGTKFELYDDDEILYYTGRIIGEYDGFEPLDDFGTPNAGAVRIKLDGRWV